MKYCWVYEHICPKIKISRLQMVCIVRNAHQVWHHRGGELKIGRIWKKTAYILGQYTCSLYYLIEIQASCYFWWDFTFNYTFFFKFVTNWTAIIVQATFPFLNSWNLEPQSFFTDSINTYGSEGDFESSRSCCFLFFCTFYPGKFFYQQGEHFHWNNGRWEAGKGCFLLCCFHCW